MATIRLLWASLCLVILGSYRLPHSSVLAECKGARERIVAIARQEIGIREKTGQNDGKSVEGYLASVGLERGNPWCAAFVCWVFYRSGFNNPRSGWSPALFSTNVKTFEIKEGNVLGIWFPNLKRIAHVGLVERQEGNWILSIEGNTNSAGSREGDGVYRKRRLKKSIYAYADWIKGRKGTKP